MAHNQVDVVALATVVKGFSHLKRCCIHFIDTCDWNFYAPTFSCSHICRIPTNSHGFSITHHYVLQPQLQTRLARLVSLSHRAFFYQKGMWIALRKVLPYRPPYVCHAISELVTQNASTLAFSSLCQEEIGGELWSKMLTKELGKRGKYFATCYSFHRACAAPEYHPILAMLAPPSCKMALRNCSSFVMWLCR